jgi:ribose transport system permease protein
VTATTAEPTSAEMVAPPPTPGARMLRFLLARGPLLMFGFVLAYLAVRSPVFLSPANLLSSLTQAAPIAIVSFGLAAVVMGGGDDVVSGGIDLSIPATAAMATAIVSDQLTNAGAGLGRALALALVAALVVGAINAFLITVVGLTSILTTLATYATVVGVVRVVTANRRISVDHPSILFFRDTKLFGLPMVVVLMLICFAAFAFLMHRTAFGMHVQAVGGSRDAAETSGISSRRHIASTFLIASVAAAVASVALTARGSGMSPGIDERLMIDMVLATFLGATFSRRNVVTVAGALLGAVFVALMSNGLILLRVDNSWVDGMKGALILVVVASAALQNRSRA